MISIISFILSTALWICVHTTKEHIDSTDNNWVKAQLVSLMPTLNKCCLDNQLYNPGYDICTNHTLVDVLLEVEPLPIFPSIDNKEDDQMSTTLLMLDNLQQLTYNEDVLKPCPDGYFVTSAMQFSLFQNGTLYTYEGLIEADQFCIHPVPPAPLEYSSGRLSFAGRFCVRNRCDSATCIRKCCPLGMALMDQKCQPSESPFKVKHYSSMIDENDDVKTSDNVISVDSGRATYQIITGLFITCSIQGLNELLTNDFRILANGHMYVPSYPCEFERPAHQYCIENYIDGNVTSLIGLRCFPKIYQHNLVADDMTESIYPYTLFVSSLFLIATFIVYAVLPEMRNTHGLVVMSHIASMTVLFVGLGMIHLNIFRPQPDLPGISNSKACIGLALVVHFSFLATFAWLQVICFDIWWTFRCSTPRANLYKPNRRVNGFFFVLYSAFGWGLPLSIVVVGQIMEHYYVTDESIIKPGFGKFECWFICWEAFAVYLYGPVTVMILMNVVFFGLTTVHLCRTKRESIIAFRNYVSNEQLNQQRARVFLSLFILMGMSWATEVISFAIGGSNSRWITTDILNTLTGVFIFITFVCKSRVWRLLKKKFPGLIWFESFLPTCCFKIDRQAQSSRTTLSSSARSRSQPVDNRQFRQNVTDKSTTSASSENEPSWPILLQHQTGFLQGNDPHSLTDDTQV